MAHDMSKMAPTPGQMRNQRALVISAILTGVYFVVELAAGLLIGSVAVLSDAFHTFSAVAGVGGGQPQEIDSLGSARLARIASRPAPWTRTLPADP